MALIDSQHLRIISGGQTGVDRAALDAAIELSLEHGGWCPKGRRAEDGVIDSRYLLRETPSTEYIERTRRNVQDSDGTLIFNRGEPEGGTALTRQFAQEMEKPYLLIDPDRLDTLDSVRQWLRERAIHTLNVAGPRASKEPLIYRATRHYLLRLLA